MRKRTWRSRLKWLATVFAGLFLLLWIFSVFFEFSVNWREGHFKAVWGSLWLYHSNQPIHLSSGIGITLATTTYPPTPIDQLLGLRLPSHLSEKTIIVSGPGRRWFYQYRLPLWGPFFLAALPAALLWYFDPRPKPGTCRKCGYDLTGNTSGRCPECGSSVDLSTCREGA